MRVRRRIREPFCLQHGVLHRHSVVPASLMTAIEPRHASSVHFPTRRALTLTLLVLNVQMQAFAYTMLICLARSTSNSDTSTSTDGTEESSYLLSSVTGAMYLLVASTMHDVRTGFSLFVDGNCAGHRAFGIGLLIVYGIIISTAMKVLVSTSDDSASVVLNAVTVLFIADLDEKTLKFLLSIPQKWRLFWAIQSIGISFSLALVAIAYMGDASPLLEGIQDFVNTIMPNWVFWAVSPAAVTWCSFRLSSYLQAACDSIEAGANTDIETDTFVLSRGLIAFRATIRGARERLRAEPCFHVLRAAWFVQGLVSWWFGLWATWYPFALEFSLNSSGDDEYSLGIVDNKYTLVTLNAVLAVGLVMKVVTVWLRRRESVTATPEPRVPFRGDGPEDIRRNCWADSRVPSLLVGWGVGYWSTSLLFVLVVSWDGGGWTNAPVYLTWCAYVIIPCFLFTGVFVVADVDCLGKRFGILVNPSVGILKNRQSVAYWSLATILRDVVNLWMLYCLFLAFYPQS